MWLINQTNGEVVAQAVMMADNFYLRLKGLLGLSVMPSNKALLIKPCRQVHMFFMGFPIVAAFLDKNGLILHVEKLEPWEVSKLVLGAAMVVEMAVEKAEKVKVGQVLKLTE